MAKAATIINIERSFEASELFFSTTDRRGVITSCNEVFTRIAEYEPQEILGQPHSIVRHPHMPRCVFFLLWEYLLSGRPIGAYVKNRSKSGAYYWVFALAMPIDSGFISIRLKPTSGALDLISSLYEKLRSIEAEHSEDRRTGMKMAYDALLLELASLGIESYDEFMSNALRSELSSRYKLLGKDQSCEESSLVRAFMGLKGLGDLRSSLRNENIFLSSFAKGLFESALNLGVKASRLGDRGRALRIISNEVASIASSVGKQTKVIVRENSVLSAQIESACFSISFATLLIEMLLFFKEEQCRATLTPAEQQLKFGKTFAELEELLCANVHTSITRAKEAQAQLGRVFSSFESLIEELVKILLSIQFSYVTGKSLAALTSGTEGFALQLSEIIERADKSRLNINELSQKISSLNADVRGWKLSHHQESTADKNTEASR